MFIFQSMNVVFILTFIQLDQLTKLTRTYFFFFKKEKIYFGHFIFGIMDLNLSANPMIKNKIFSKDYFSLSLFFVSFKIV